MFNINIFSKYKVLEQIKDCYKSYDSDADDWFKIDNYEKEYELDAIGLINNINQRLDVNLSEFCDFNIKVTEDKHLQLKISTFDPTNGEGTDYIYQIEEIFSGENR